MRIQRPTGLIMPNSIRRRGRLQVEYATTRQYACAAHFGKQSLASPPLYQIHDASTRVQSLAYSLARALLRLGFVVAAWLVAGAGNSAKQTCNAILYTEYARHRRELSVGAAYGDNEATV